MKHSRVKKLLIDWMDGRVNEPVRSSIQAHLESCPSCKEYYEKMTALLGANDPGLLPTLEPDPHLPAKIRALGARKSLRLSRLRARARLRWAKVSLAGAMAAAAVALGVLLGIGLVETTSAGGSASGEDEIVTAYRDALNSSGLGERWGLLIEQEEESTR